jgi:hypothetical protein
LTTNRKATTRTDPTKRPATNTATTSRRTRRAPVHSAPAAPAAALRKR